MEQQDRRNVVSAVVSVLRKATRIVQIAPFAYLCFYVVYMLFGYFASEELLCLADDLFAVLPMTIVGMLILSHLFKLCVWHKVACVIPALSQIEAFVDRYIITLTQTEVLVINTSIGLSSLVFLCFAIKHFSNGFKEARRANA